jgi:hypothetical protein
LALSPLCGGRLNTLSCTTYIPANIAAVSAPNAFPLTYLNSWSFDVYEGVNNLTLVDNNNNETNTKFSQGTLVLLTLFDESGVQIKFTINNNSNLNDLLLYENDTNHVSRPPKTTTDSLKLSNFTICMRTLTKRQYYIVKGSFQSTNFTSSGMRMFTASFLNSVYNTVVKNEILQVNVVDRKYLYMK